MHIAFISLGASAGALILLTTLFHVERTRGTRFARTLRERCDHVVERLFATSRNFVAAIERDVLRIGLHRALHQMLHTLLAAIRVLERYVGKLMRTNRTIAVRGMRRERETNRLDEIAEHKAEVALSDDEKRRHKEHSVGTAL